ncbi:MAG: hypothetical protein II501_03220 [Clostridia bacterium]|nr:hypothetical protein [Clostridia bacterium]
MKKRIKIIIVAAVVIIAATTATVLFAYLQSMVNQPNKFNIGEGNIAVTEVFTEPDSMTMGDFFEKVVAVKNTGASSQFARVYLDFSDSRVKSEAKIVYTKNGIRQEKSWNDFLADLPENWVYVSENDLDGALLGGYFYYSKVLAKGSTTSPLINGVITDFTTAEGDTNADNISNFDIVVYSECVQTTEIDSDGTVYTNNDWRSAWNSFLALSQ